MAVPSTRSEKLQLTPAFLSGHENEKAITNYKITISFRCNCGMM